MIVAPVNFSAENAVGLWWSDRARRPNQVPRKEYSPREAPTGPDITSDDQDTAEQEFSLNDWDEWFAADT